MNSKQRRQREKQRKLINVGRTAQAQIQAAEARAAVLAGEKAQLTNQFLSTRDTSLGLRAQLAAALAEVERLETVVWELNKSYEIQRNLIMRLEADNADLHVQLSVAKHEHETAIEQVREELSRKSNQLSDVHSEIIFPLENEVQELRAELRPFRRRLKAKTDEITKLQGLLSKYRSRLVALSGGISFDATQELFKLHTK